jgi:hypothetical protein
VTFLPTADYPGAIDVTTPQQYVRTTEAPVRVTARARPLSTR